MTSLTIKIPESLKDQAEEMAEERGYQNTSEYVRTAIREKVEGDMVVTRIEDDEGDAITIEQAREFVREKDGSQNQEKSNQLRP